MTENLSIEKLSSEVTNIIETTSKFIVLVQGRRAPASGVVWRNNLIVTAAHSLPRADELQVQIPSGDLIRATVAGRDPSTDIALLKTDTDLQPAEATAGAKVKAGQLAVSIGRARGGRLLAVLSMVSGTDDSYKNWTGGTFDQFIRLDTMPYPGFSGSALVNAGGKIIGMNTAVFSRHFGLTVPASNIESLVKRLSEKGSIGRPYLGLMMQPVRLPENLRTEAKVDIGLLIVGTEKESPVERAGLFTGDIVVGLDEKTVNSTEEIHGFLSIESIGKDVKLKFLRGGKLQMANVKIGQRPPRK